VAEAVCSNFDSIFRLLKITLVASSNANEVEDSTLASMGMSSVAL